MTHSRTIGKRFATVLAALLLVAQGGALGVGDDRAAAPFFALSSAKGEAATAAQGDSQARYDAAQALYDAHDFLAAAEAFDALGAFSDSRGRAADSRRQWKAARYKEAMALYKDEAYQQALTIFTALDNYKESRSYALKCARKVNAANYLLAKELFAAGEYEEAKALFEALGKYRDSRDRAQAADDILQARAQAAAERKLYEQAMALKESGDLEAARETLIEAGDCLDATDQLYAINRTLALRSAYERAEGCVRDGDYEGACDLFSALGAHEDSAEKALSAQEMWLDAVYEQAVALQSGDPARAYILFHFLGERRDSAALADALRARITEQGVYDAADALAREERYAQAASGFEAVSAYADSRERAAQASLSAEWLQSYRQALCLLDIGEVEQANAIFTALGDFRDAAKKIAPVPARFTTKQLRDDRTSPRSDVFTAPDGTRHSYRIYKGVHTWVEAKAFCEAMGGHLATLTTAEENMFVYNFMRECGYLTAYFGLSDEARVGDWIWVTGEPFEYANWHRGEPSRSGRERYGMYFYKHLDGTWNDAHFYEDAEVDPGCSYICEWDE